MSQPPPKRPELEEEETFIAIRWLVAVLRVIEDLITAVSGYGIIFALGVGAVDLFTDGQLTSNLPWLDYLYAFALAAGIGGQLIAVASRASRAFHNGNAWAGVGFTLLALVLAFVEYEAAVVYGFHKVFNQPVATSLLQLGISQGSFIQLRSGTSVVLALLSGFLRYQPKVRKSAAEVEAEQEEKRRIQAAIRQTRQAQLAGIRGMVQTTIGQQSTEETPPNEEPLSAFSGDNGGESEADDPTLNPRWLPANRWRWQELQAWIKTEYNVEVSEDQARDIVKSTAKAEKAKHAGNPTIAPIGLMKKRAIAALNLRNVRGIPERKVANS